MIGRKHDALGPGIAPRNPWQAWWAWRPVMIKGQSVWLKKVYRRRINNYITYDDWNRYEYGDFFDYLRWRA